MPERNLFFYFGVCFGHCVEVLSVYQALLRPVLGGKASYISADPGLADA